MLCRVCLICASYRSILKAFPMVSCVPDVEGLPSLGSLGTGLRLQNPRRGLPGVTRNGGEETPGKLELPGVQDNLLSGNSHFTHHDPGAA